VSSTIVLHVSGDDYSAMNFEQNFDAQTVYEEMVSKNETLKVISTDEYYIEVKIHEFGYVDDGFVCFLFESMFDYDSLKHECIYFVEEVK